jgi:hypothetical protein
MKPDPSERTRDRARGLTAMLQRARENAAADRIARTKTEKLGCTLTEKDQRIFPKFAEVMWGGVHAE